MCGELVINYKSESTNIKDVAYTNNGSEEMLKILNRECFPGYEEEFYEYGKWGGGAFSSTAFEELPMEEQKAIENYLRQLGLYF